MNQPSENGLCQPKDLLSGLLGARPSTGAQDMAVTGLQTKNIVACDVLHNHYAQEL